MTGLMVTEQFVEGFGVDLKRAAVEAGLDIELLVHSNERGTNLAPELLPRVEIAYLSSDLYPGNFRGFFESLTQAPNLRWVQVFYVGADGPLWVPLVERGVTLTNSAGATGQIIAQTAIAPNQTTSAPPTASTPARLPDGGGPTRLPSASTQMEIWSPTFGAPFHSNCPDRSPPLAVHFAWTVVVLSA